MNSAMRETALFYFFLQHQFGQWTLRDMLDTEGRRYNCCEQYMMFHKASLFGDRDSAEKIMQQSDPARQKQLGRAVKGFDSALWNQHKFGIVWSGNYLKFSQHDDLRRRLLSTGDKMIVEASPFDRVWGVGLAAQDDRILDPANWRGQNLLGKVLMSVRQAVSEDCSPA
jgi:ribA/ribD-fused uncharacterized protein